MLRLAARQPWRVPLPTVAARLVRTKAGSRPPPPPTQSEDVAAPVQASAEEQNAFHTLQDRLAREFAELQQMQSDLDGSLNENEAEAEQNMKKMSPAELLEIESRLGEKFWDEESLKVLEHDPEEFARTFGMPGQTTPSALRAKDENTSVTTGDSVQDAFTRMLDKYEADADSVQFTGTDPRELFDDTTYNPHDPVQAFSKQVRDARVLNPVVDLEKPSEAWDPSHISDPTKLPRQIKDIRELGDNFSEEEYASALIHGRSVYPPFFHSRSSDIPVAVLHLRSHHPKLMDMFAHFALHAASALAIPTSTAVKLPTQRSLWTVIRGPFVNKKSQENFERKVHKRCIKAWDADPQVVDTWMRYLKKHAMGGVGMRMISWERLPLGLDSAPRSQQQPAGAPKQLPKPGKTLSGLNTKRSKAGPGVHIEHLGKKIVADESKQATTTA